MKANLTLQDSLEQLIHKGIELDDNYKEQITHLDMTPTLSKPPWYMSLFITATAWISSMTVALVIIGSDLVRFLTLAGIWGLFIWGLLFCIGSTILNRFGPPNDFTRQVGLATNLIGQGMILSFLVSDTNLEPLSIALIMLILEATLFWVYDDPRHRVASTLGVLGAILTIFMIKVPAENARYLLTFPLGLGLIFLQQYEPHWYASQREHLTQPIVNGTLLFFFGLLLTPPAAINHLWSTTSLLLLILLLILSYLIILDLRLAPFGKTAILFYTGCLLLTILTLNTPGIIGTLFILLLSFWRNKRVHMRLSAALLLYSIATYYFWLVWPYMINPIGLIGAGSLMLLLRYGLRPFTPKGKLS